METKKIDAFVVALALEESHDIEKGHWNFLDNPDLRHLEQLREESRKHIEDEHFISVKIYNRALELIVAAKRRIWPRPTVKILTFPPLWPG